MVTQWYELAAQFFILYVEHGAEMHEIRVIFGLQCAVISDAERYLEVKFLEVDSSVAILLVVHFEAWDEGALFRYENDTTDTRMNTDQ